jgi:hypothetical protein
MKIQPHLEKKLLELRDLRVKLDDSIKAVETTLGLYDLDFKITKLDKTPKVTVEEFVSKSSENGIPNNSPTEAVRYFIAKFHKGQTVKALEISKTLQEVGYTPRQIYPPISEVLKQGELKKTSKQGVYKKT